MFNVGMGEVQGLMCTKYVIQVLGCNDKFGMKLLTSIVIIEKHLSQTKCTNQSEYLFVEIKTHKKNCFFKKMGHSCL